MSELPPDLANLFAAERSAASPGDDAQRAVRARLGATLGIAAAATATTSGTASAATSSAKIATLKIVTVVAGLIGIGAVIRYATMSPAPRAAVAERGKLDGAVVESSAEAPTPVAPTAATVETPPVIETPPPAAAPVIPRKQHSRVVVASQPRDVAQPATTSQPAAVPPPPTQVALLHDATTTLTTDPARTLALVEEDARAHANGPLAEEREALRIHALVALGRTSDARTAAQQLLTRFPTTVHRALAERTLSITEATK